MNPSRPIPLPYSGAGFPPSRPAPQDFTPVSEFERLQAKVRPGLWLPMVFLVAAVLLAFAADSIGDWICAVIVFGSAHLPIYLWVTRRVVGMPTLPILAIAYAVFYGLPFVSGNPLVAQYEFGEKLLAAATIAFVLVLATFTWAFLAYSGPPRIRHVRVIMPGLGEPTLLVCLAAGCLYQINSFLWVVNIPYELFGVMRAVLQNIALVSVFALSFLMGTGHLKPKMAMAYGVLFVVFASASVMSFYLNGAMEIVFLGLFGLFLGSGRVPWKVALLLVVVFTVLHAGKANMREQYWAPETGLVPPRNPLVTIEEWVGHGISAIVQPVAANEGAPSLIERASLLHMLLRTQTEAPERVPFLFGASYFEIPLLMIPRFVWPERPSTQELLIRLNEHYGLLTREQAATTSIGWGLVAEAYANFGLGGVFILAVVMGTVLGFLQRWGGRYPMLSARAITTLVVLLTMLRLETNFALLATSLFQAMAPLVLIVWFLMRDRRVVV